jgi:hypothetical protein
MKRKPFLNAVFAMGALPGLRFANMVWKMEPEKITMPSIYVRAT